MSSHPKFTADEKCQLTDIHVIEQMALEWGQDKDDFYTDALFQQACIHRMHETRQLRVTIPFLKEAFL